MTYLECVLKKYHFRKVTVLWYAKVTDAKVTDAKVTDTKVTDTKVTDESFTKGILSWDREKKIHLMDKDELEVVAHSSCRFYPFWNFQDPAGLSPMQPCLIP